MFLSSDVCNTYSWHKHRGRAKITRISRRAGNLACTHIIYSYVCICRTQKHRGARTLSKAFTFAPISSKALVSSTLPTPAARCKAVRLSLNKERGRECVKQGKREEVRRRRFGERKQTRPIFKNVALSSLSLSLFFPISVSEPQDFIDFLVIQRLIPIASSIHRLQPRAH